ncbi:nuclear transport factor 2 family protein [Mycobacterium sp. smrl_JER01]|uniref:nuclear transport factor 2 family protein n=1 Tax=Mycobacterium sp. smrl_JER01 TaxID=3402633 RepID=UPI003ABE7834
MTSTRWTTTIPATLLGTAAIVAGSSLIAAGAGSAHAEPSPGGESRNAQVVREAFATGVGAPDTFYAILADEVTWTVARADTPATYTGRQHFLDSGAQPVVDRLTGQIDAEVHEMVADGGRVVARWRGTATALDGQPYVNEYNWVMTMADDRVTHVVAYLDFVALDALLHRVPLR